MKKIFLILLVLCNCLAVIAQRGDNTWVFGIRGSYRVNQGVFNNWVGNSILDFNYFPPKVSLDTLMIVNPTNGTSAGISDSNGRLLFYTDGVHVMDSTRALMHNGDSLNCCGSFWHDWNNPSDGYPCLNCATVIPYPDHPDKYILLHSRENDTPGTGYYLQNFPLYYSVVDMQGNHGRGDMVQKREILTSDSTVWAGVRACKHANGRDWWVIILNHWGYKYYRFLLTPRGFTQYPDQYTGFRFPADGGGGGGLFLPMAIIMFGQINILRSITGILIDVAEFYTIIKILDVILFLAGSPSFLPILNIYMPITLEYYFKLIFINLQGLIWIPSEQWIVLWKCMEALIKLDFLVLN